MNLENMKTVFEDREFVKSLLELESVSEVQTALKGKDIEISETDILSIRDILSKVECGEVTSQQVENGELPEEILEQVAGGSVAFLFSLILTGLVAGGGIGSGIALSVSRKW